MSTARLGWLAAGVAAIVGGTLLGWDSRLLDSAVHPPALIRAALVGASVVLGLALIRNAVQRISGAVGPRPGAVERDLPGLIRAVRLVFLAVAAFAAASGWLLGHPLPFVIALVIAGVDVLETSFLLLVVTLRRGQEP